MWVQYLDGGSVCTNIHMTTKLYGTEYTPAGQTGGILIG